MKKYVNGTPLSSFDGPSDDVVSVASFNLLAPLYVRPIDQRTGKVQPFASFEWISEEDSEAILGNDIRLPKLLKRLQDCDSDFICVQELQLGREEMTCEDDVKNDESNYDHTTRQQKRGRTSRKEDEGGQIDIQPTTDQTKPLFVLPTWISPLVNVDVSPYGIILPEQAELNKIAERNVRVLQADAAVTNAIFYKRDKWRPYTNSKSYNYSNTTTCVVQAFLSVDDGMDQSEKNADPIVITSIHLDAQREEKRVQQLLRCLEQTIASSSTPYIPPLIIAGDYNAELFRGSCLYEFLSRDGETEEPVASSIDATKTQEMQFECSKALRLPSNTSPSKEEMKSWYELHDVVANYVTDHCWTLKRIDTGCTRVAYDHDEEVSNENGDATMKPKDETTTNSDSTMEQLQRSMAQWHLDHIVYTPLTLTSLGKWATLEDDHHSAKFGLPNRIIPTDHLPIAASFRRLRHPRLSKEEKDTVVAAMDEISNRHNLELETIQTETDRVKEELEQQQRLKDEQQSAEPENTEVQRTKKPKKSKKSRPSPEIIQHVRDSRARIKQLKADQSAERHKFIGCKSVLERMELQHSLGGRSCRQWAEDG